MHLRMNLVLFFIVLFNLLACLLTSLLFLSASAIFNFANDLKGAARYVRFNVGLEVGVSLGINAVDYTLRDEATSAEFVGNSAADMIKGITALGAVVLFTAAVPISIGIVGSGIFLPRHHFL